MQQWEYVGLLDNQGRIEEAAQLLTYPAVHSLHPEVVFHMRVGAAQRLLALRNAYATIQSFLARSYLTRASRCTAFIFA